MARVEACNFHDIFDGGNGCVSLRLLSLQLVLGWTVAGRAERCRHRPHAMLQRALKFVHACLVELVFHLSLDSFTLSVAAEAQSFAVVGSAVGSLQLDSCLDYKLASFRIVAGTIMPKYL